MHPNTGKNIVVALFLLSCGVCQRTGGSVYRSSIVDRSIRLVVRGDQGRIRDVAVVLFEQARLPSGYHQLDRDSGGVLSVAMKRPEFSAKEGALATLYPKPSGRSGARDRLFVLGLGKPKGAVAEAMRIGMAKLFRAAQAAGVTRLSLRLVAGLAGCLDAESAGRAVADGLSIANFTFDTFKGAASGAQPTGKRKRSGLALDVEAEVRSALRRGLVIGESVNTARRLAATPPNVANPAYLVRHCRALSRRVGLRCTVIDVHKAGRLKMGGLLAVGRAGSTPPALICLEHRPPRARSQPVLLVGKAVTFDTGGYSIKTGPGMEDMKYDKCGGMAVIGAMCAIARLKLPVPVVALVAAAENMVDQKAFRPGDILSMHNGVTVEVTNTDAEGRLVLGDALAYGSKRFRPQAVIDLATLTGGVVVALGSRCAGMFCNQVDLQHRLLEAGRYSGERLWCLPLWPEHRQQLKGTHGDILNSAGREAHPIQGAAFLSHFVDAASPTAFPKTPWAHLDIAGVSDVKASDNPLYGKGPTGFGVRLLVRTIETWSGRSKVAPAACIGPG